MYLIMLRSIIAVHVFIQRADLDFPRHRLGVPGPFSSNLISKSIGLGQTLELLIIKRYSLNYRRLKKLVSSKTLQQLWPKKQ